METLNNILTVVGIVVVLWVGYQIHISGLK